MSVPMTIAICGARGAGKDTLARHIASRYGHEHLHFATPLKTAVTAMFGLTHEEVYGNRRDVPHARWGATPREIMQHVGTDVCRKTYGDSFWIDRFPWHEHPLKVVSDLRFENERAAILAYDPGALIVRVRDNFGRMTAADHHASETSHALFEAHATLVNDGSPRDLFDRFDIMMAEGKR